MNIVAALDPEKPVDVSDLGSKLINVTQEFSQDESSTSLSGLAKYVGEIYVLLV